MRKKLFGHFQIFAVGLVVGLLAGFAFAAPTSPGSAKKVVSGWLKSGAAPFGINERCRPYKVETFTDPAGEPLYYVVYLRPAGFVVVAADDRVEPIIALADDGRFDPSEDNPLGAMVSRDLPARMSAVRSLERDGGGAPARGGRPAQRLAALEQVSSQAQQRWLRLLEDANSGASEEGLLEVEAGGAEPLTVAYISEIRVAPLVQSRWDQSTICASNPVNCYNFYTPENYVCGCVATGMAQLMRYHEYPAGGIGIHTFTVTVDGTERELDTRGGNGFGGAYDWSAMVLEPGCGTSEAERQAIGALCYDAGLSVNMMYTELASGAWVVDAKNAMQSLFGYANSVLGGDEIQNIGSGLLAMINPNLDAGLPVLFGILGNSGAHCVVCDGYGYDADTAYHHLNMGWSGSDDAWYNLPDIVGDYADFEVVNSCVYNVFPTGGGQIISGRVTDVFDSPVSGATVTAVGPGGPFSDVTNAQGIYALVHVQSLSDYVVDVTYGSESFDEQQVTTGLSVDGEVVSGNVWAVDFQSVGDLTAPTPDPAQWDIVPKATGLYTIDMAAAEATDAGGVVEYYFECVEDANFDSGWQSEPRYTVSDGNMSEATIYTWRLRVRDDSNNMTAWSVQQDTTTASGTDTLSPSPDPARWLTKPRLLRLLPIPMIRMEAGPATDENGVEYYFTCVTDGSFDSGWLAEPLYTLRNGSLVQGDTYTFTVKARDGIGNETAASAMASVTLGTTGVNILTVPEPYETIQDAIDEADNGDVVVVSPGRYTGDGNRDLDFKGKKITVRSTDPNNWNTVSATIIDCQNMMSHRGFDFHTMETQDSVVAGFTITGGYIREDADAGPTFGAPGGDANDSTGGAINCTLNSGPTIRNCIITDCVAEGGWGGNGADGNDVDPYVPADGGAGGKSGAAYGGAIYADATSSPTVIDCTINNCLALGGRGGNGGNGIVDGDGAGGNGGDSSKAAGGAIYSAGGTGVVVVNCTFTNNQAVAGQGGAGGTGASNGEAGSDGKAYGGGGYYTATCNNSTMTGSTIQGSSADNNGGGVYCESGSTVTLNTSSILENSAGGDGGGIWYGGKTGKLTLNGCEVSNNTVSDGVGGGIYAGDMNSVQIGTMDVNETTISGNMALYGAGLYLLNTTLDTEGSTIKDNMADRDGAGVWCFKCVVDMNSSTIKNNTALGTGGAGDGSGGGLNSIAGLVTLRNSVVSENDAAGPGGGMYFTGWGDPNYPHKVLNCLVRGNTAGNDGGGLSCNLCAWVAVTNSTVVGNVVSDGSGGGVNCAENWAYVEIKNSILWDNVADYGSQIGVGRVYGSPQYGDGPYADVDVSYSDLQGGQSAVFLEDEDEIYTILWWLVGNIDEDPLFAATDAAQPDNNYYLTQTAAGQVAPNSPCVDSGDTGALIFFAETGLTTTTRTDGLADTDTVDMGYHYPAGLEVEQYKLTIEVVDTGYGGYGTVLPPWSPGVYDVNAGDVAELIAEPNEDWEVLEWTGTDGVPFLDPADPNRNTVTMNSDKTVTVEFVPIDMYKLVTLVTAGDGTVSPAGLTIHQPGAVVDLLATADNPSDIINWTNTDDDYSHSRENTVTMDDHKTVLVEFYASRKLYVGADSNYPTIQLAIEAARDGDVIMLTPDPNGYDIYESSEDRPYLYLDGKAITITSTNPSDPNATTIIGGFVIENVGRDTVIEGVRIQARYWGRIGEPNPNAQWHMATPEGPGIDGPPGIDTLGAGMELVGTSSPTVRNCVFENCEAFGIHGGTGNTGTDEQGWGGNGGPGGKALGGGAYCGPSSSPLFENCSFVNCLVRGGDGGNGANNPPGGPPGHGGAWGDKDAPWWWEMEDRYGHELQDYWKYSGYGGAAYCAEGSSPEFVNCRFSGNRAEGGSCGISGSDPGVSGWPYHHYKIDHFGGAVYVANNSSPKFTNCVFNNNESDVEGPSVHYWDTQLTFNAYTNISYGGSVAFESWAMPQFDNCTFNNNTANIGGGMYWTWSEPVLSECLFENNTALGGGGLFFVGGYGRIASSVFTGNSATGAGSAGGGICCLGANAMIVDCNISNNSTASMGGGIYISSKHVDGDDIEGWNSGFNTVLLKNSMISSNVSSGSGGGIAAQWNSDPNIVNCTIADNRVSGEGGGLYCGYGNYTNIVNTIIWGNLANNDPQQIAIGTTANPSTVSVSYSDIQGGEAGVEFATGIAADYLIWDDNSNLTGLSLDNPLFIAGDLGDYYLSQIDASDANDANYPEQTVDSPCVNAGLAEANSLPFGQYRYTTRTDNETDANEIDIGYHFDKSGAFAAGDLNYDGEVTLADWLIWMGSEWLGRCTFPGWCEGADINRDGIVNFVDEAILLSFYGEGDTQAPVPNPSTWSLRPTEYGSSSARMMATPSFDNSGSEVVYYFDCVSGDCNDRGWDVNSTYVDTDLAGYDANDPNTEYAYRVRAADRSGKDFNDAYNSDDPYDPNVGNKTEWSAIAFVVVTGEGTGPGDNTAPSNLRWVIEPRPTGPNSIEMQAAAEDPSGVEYYFEDMDHPQYNSGWQSSGYWEDTGLDAETEYRYRVRARDSYGNTTDWLGPLSATTPAEGVDTDAPVTDPTYPEYDERRYTSTWEDFPHEVVRGTEVWAVMTVTEATDESTPVEYKFVCTNEDGFSSGGEGDPGGTEWREERTYEVLVRQGTPGAGMRFKVKARDSAEPIRNEGYYSETVPAY